MKKVVLYSAAHAESIISAAAILENNKDYIPVDIANDKEVSKALSGKGNKVFRLVDEMDERHLNGDTVFYQAKPKNKGQKRLLELFVGETPYIANAVANYNTNQDSELFKAGIISVLSDLSNGGVRLILSKLLNNDLDSINKIKMAGGFVVSYNKVMANNLKPKAKEAPKKEPKVGQKKKKK